MQSSPTLRVLHRLYPSGIWERRAVQVFLFSIAAIFCIQAFVWMLNNRLHSWGPYGVDAFVEGYALKPFVYRQLLPKTTILLEDILPDQLVERLSVPSYFAMVKLVKKERQYHDRPEIQERLVNPGIGTLNRWFIMNSLSAVFFIAYGVMLFLLGSTLFYDRLSRWVAPILGYAMVPVGFYPASHYYDTPVLFFSAAIFYAILKKKDIAVIILFTLACINKETAIYLWGLYALCAPKDKHYFAKVGFLLAIWLVVNGITHTVYDDNRGKAAFIFFDKNYLSTMHHKLAFGKFVIFMAGFFMLFYQWQEKPLMLRRSAWVIVVSFIAWLIFGLVDELRAMYEAYPFVALMLIHSILSATKLQQARLFRHV